ncbi:hypothetical protein E2C01_050769 [Portunus trituberculatus]|uniref:Uncharacterized protein n=1 Tax=Portunus trituberculatus TaxID=210409 RepID=A0A5B7GCZ3_PORTR|nr:hypothetical protein [Portunus trituberculatus]
MATSNPASESSSEEGTRNVSRSDCSLVDDPKRLNTSVDFSSLPSATYAVLHLIFNLWNTTFHLLNRFFTETQLSEATDNSPFSVPSYFVYSHFCSKVGCYVYMSNDLTCSHAHALESSEFSAIWLRLKSHSLTKFICAVYLSPNSSSKLEHILFLYHL